MDIAIIEPSDKHYYQPGWTLVGGGIAPISKFIHAYVLPWLYWNRMLKGKGFEADVFKPINKLVRR